MNRLYHNNLSTHFLKSNSFERVGIRRQIRISSGRWKILRLAPVPQKRRQASDRL